MIPTETATQISEQQEQGSCEKESSRHRSHDDIFCPINGALDLLTARWTLHIVRALLSGPCRFNEIAQAYGINAHTLRERLRSLENEGVVTRTVISAMPPNVEYALTEKGLALNRVFEELADWGRVWVKPPQ
jgi:DNA-binding HxlR family transcriptional regulator